jgi:hypothetical protein
MLTSAADFSTKYWMQPYPNFASRFIFTQKRAELGAF